MSASKNVNSFFITTDNKTAAPWDTCDAPWLAHLSWLTSSLPCWSN